MRSTPAILQLGVNSYGIRVPCNRITVDPNNLSPWDNIFHIDIDLYFLFTFHIGYIFKAALSGISLTTRHIQILGRTHIDMALLFDRYVYCLPSIHWMKLK